MNVFWRQVSPPCSYNTHYSVHRFSSGLGAFRVTVSVVVGSGRLFAALVLFIGAVFIGVDWQFPAPRCTLYSGSAGCAPNPFITVDAMYLAFVSLDALHLAFDRPSMSRTISLCLFLRRVCSHPPRRGPCPPVIGVTRAGRLLSRLRGGRGRAIMRLS